MCAMKFGECISSPGLFMLCYGKVRGKKEVESVVGEMQLKYLGLPATLLLT